jgi:HK97 family phage prohead protease
MTTTASKREIRFLPAKELRVKQTEKGKQVSGYAAVFNSPSEDLGGFVEQIAPGAFTRTLLGNPDVMFLHEHDPKQGLLGRTKSSTLRLIEDNVGLRFEADLPNTSLGNDVATSIDRGDLDGMSFGFVAIKDEWKQANSQTVRTLLDVELFEITATCMPAYPATSVQMRSLLFPDGFPQVEDFVPPVAPELRAEDSVEEAETSEPSADMLLAEVLERRTR